MSWDVIFIYYQDLQSSFKMELQPVKDSNVGQDYQWSRVSFRVKRSISVFYKSLSDHSNEDQFELENLFLALIIRIY